MKEIEICKKEDLELDFSTYDIVKIKENSYVHLNFMEFIRKEFADYLVTDNRREISFKLEKDSKTWHRVICFGYENSIGYSNDEFSLERKKDSLVPQFYKDGVFHFPLKSLKKILKTRKDRKTKDVMYANANKFSFKLFSSIMLEELTEMGFENIQQTDTSIYISGIFNINESTYKATIRKQHDLDENFPLILNIYGNFSSATFRLTWKSAKQILIGISYLHKKEE